MTHSTLRAVVLIASLFVGAGFASMVIAYATLDYCGLPVSLSPCGKGATPCATRTITSNSR